ncbi:PaaX family transcriptional regulator C-terminal domain-containing protein [Salinicola endophyticus]|uniref:PaaX family transcriptional regulator C-terminal domain-containing protein n=1 Tax=Salinicola endophyticus TaxID=1949083 RepID=UPI000DA22D7C|nr:PaaX family transcriptional regulator C-terminal domain-containing protein [Salinicola endophyticus]
MAPRSLRLQVRQSWQLDELAGYYQRFLEQFRPLWSQLRDDDRLDEQECFIARTLLIHEYRKVQLRAPQLPDALLPTSWEGHHAHQLCRNIYRVIHRRAERWLDRHLETAGGGGPLPAPGPSLYQRFGSLD